MPASLMAKAELGAHSKLLPSRGVTKKPPGLQRQPKPVDSESEQSKVLIPAMLPSELIARACALPIGVRTVVSRVMSMRVPLGAMRTAWSKGSDST